MTFWGDSIDLSIILHPQNKPTFPTMSILDRPSSGIPKNTQVTTPNAKTLQARYHRVLIKQINTKAAPKCPKKESDNGTLDALFGLQQLWKKELKTKKMLNDVVLLGY